MSRVFTAVLAVWAIAVFGGCENASSGGAESGVTGDTAVSGTPGTNPDASSMNTAVISWTGLSADGENGKSATKKLTFTFSENVGGGFTEDLITITDKAGKKIAPGNLTKTGRGVYEADVSGITGNGVTWIVTLADPAGWAIYPKKKMVTAYDGTPSGGKEVSWRDLSADGKSGSQATTTLTFTFNADMGAAFTKDLITIIDAADNTIGPGNVTRRSAGVYEVSVSGIRENGLILTVRLADPPGWTIGPKEREVKAYKATNTAGNFRMGSFDSEAGRGDNETSHLVTLSTFTLWPREVTQWEYYVVTGHNPSFFGYSTRLLPVERVTWYDAVEYCNKRSERENLRKAYTITGRTPESGYPITAAKVEWDKSADGYRLPTEAEWEYACRGGTATPFSTGNDITTAQANYGRYKDYPYTDDAQKISPSKTTAVGSFTTVNSFGLFYDMHGNVQEWCWDRYMEDYQTLPPKDPSGPPAGEYRVIRGGSWNSAKEYVRSACRGFFGPGFRSSDIGFRVVRSGVH